MHVRKQNVMTCCAAVANRTPTLKGWVLGVWVYEFRKVVGPSFFLDEKYDNSEGNIVCVHEEF